MMCRWTVRGAERLKLPGAQDRARQIEGRFMYDPHVARWLHAFLDHWLVAGANGAGRKAAAGRA
jgi:GMP synthase (glutamine-hydrolysing)